MTSQALTLLQQARSFIRAGDAERAADLLRRARMLAGQDSELQYAILTELVGVAGAAGLGDEAVVWQEQLASLEASRKPAAVAGSGGGSTRRSVVAWPRNGSLKYLIGAGLLLFGGILLSGSVSSWWGSGSVVVNPGTHDEKTITKRDARIQDMVGFLTFVQRYEREGKTQDYVLGGHGTGFAVHRSGVMLTNKHVTDMRHDFLANLPDSDRWRRVGDVRLMVCFGPDPKQHYEAKILHESVAFDLAVIRVPREFDEVFELAWSEPISMGLGILAVGYPGTVVSIGVEANRRDLAETLAKFSEQGGHFGLESQFPPDSFRPVATRGIISIPNSDLNSSRYHVHDATITGGNSGGPLIVENSQRVIGINTLEATKQEFNYALALPQLREEVERYLR